MSKRIEIKNLLEATELDVKVVVKGWVRNYRGNSFVMFAALNDGSSLQNLQVVIDIEKFDAAELKKISVWTICPASCKRKLMPRRRRTKEPISNIT